MVDIQGKHRMNKQALKNKLQEHGLEKYFDKLDSVVRNTIRLNQTPIAEDKIKIGQTKIGGLPDLPKNFAWVVERNTVVTDEQKILFFNYKKKKTTIKSLSFIAQINLAEIAPLDSENLLPKSGMLYFFYSAEQEVWGFDNSDKNKFKVLYFEGNINELARTAYPIDLPEYSRFKPCAVTAAPEISFPPYEHEVYQEFQAQERDKFWTEIYEDGNINKVLGYSDNIQSEMELECELVTNGLYCGDSTGYNDPRANELAPNAKNWRLLLQIDSNEKNEMMWGDCGRLYFWIKIDDLVNRRFDKSWFALQCC